ncbi:Crp/Fnr family transcriptional regulator [Ideonella livida]|uniref:Crp/Fnr family transcriptional regulator n=1 Tax=Ideonella livida TaxID=2707176 RepID=A0A7C9PGQ6_9BURK|nr:Crp/Fnr family transcriptional regulator [Ideonella livida]NDY91475.1 Crp/Fnr family transcriptional regulator [Ideonella livida]
MENRAFDLPRYLSVLPLFQEMTAEELQRLAQGCRLRRLARGDNIFRVGEPCEEFHVTVMGQVKLFALSPAGQEKVIELIGPGNSFAEALMFTDKPYIINAQALTDSLVLSVHKSAVVGEIERDPRFAMRMLAGISRRLHGLVHDVQAYSLHSGLQRVIGYLLRDLPEEAEEGATALRGTGAGCETLCREGDRPRELHVSLPVSKATIASRLSLTPEYFSRVLHELAGQGLIEIDKRDIRIPDAAALARFQMQ